MKYECRPADRDHYAASLALDPQSERLTWAALPGQDSLLVQTPYGVDPSGEPETLKELLERVCGARLPEGRFYELNREISVRYVRADEKARNQGCRANGEACTYTVFPCVIQADVCSVFLAGGRDSLSSPRCDAPMNIRAEVTPVKSYAERWLRLFRREQPVEFFKLAFPGGCPEHYRDGDIEYAVNDRWRVPVTRQMLERGEFYVRTDRKPVLTPRNAGVRLTEPRRES